jgi:GDPmannose 4,6-dehydratase
VDEQFYRPAEVHLLKGDYSKGKKVLGWEPKVRFQELVKMMVDADLQNAGRSNVREASA